MVCGEVDVVHPGSVVFSLRVVLFVLPSTASTPTPPSSTAFFRDGEEEEPHVPAVITVREGERCQILSSALPLWCPLRRERVLLPN